MHCGADLPEIEVLRIWSGGLLTVGDGTEQIRSAVDLVEVNSLIKVKAISCGNAVDTYPNSAFTAKNAK